MTVHPRALDYTQSFLSGVIPDQAELTAGQRVEPGRSYGFFTDTTLCIGCKACEVACSNGTRRRPMIWGCTAPATGMASVRPQCRRSRAIG